MVSKDLKIEIRTIPNRNGIKEFSENLEYFSQAHTITAFVNPVSLRYETGLSEEDLEYLKSKNCPYDLNDQYQAGIPHKFWESPIVKVELRSSPMFLFPGRSIIDFIKWKYLLVNSYIYSSETEMKSASKPQATHYIYNQSEETDLKAVKLEKRNDLIKQTSKLSLKRKRDVVLIIENEVTENKDENYLVVKIDEIIQSKTKSKQLALLLEGDIDDVSLTAEIKSAIQKNVLKKTKKGVFFFESNLGFSEDEVKDFLSLPENQEILLNIKSKI